jgi:hypothetical protein
MKNAITWLLIQLLALPLPALASAPPTSAEAPYYANQNWLTNPGAELGLKGVSATGVNPAITTTAANLLGGRSGLYPGIEDGLRSPDDHLRALHQGRKRDGHAPRSNL